MTTRTASGVRDQLRSATRSAHQVTDELMSSHADVGCSTGYPIFLAVMHDVFARFGADCDHASRAMDLPERAQRLHACLERDLHALDTPVSSKQESPASIFDASSLHWAYGCAYALEGSALGAAVLQRSVNADQQHATSYLDHLVSDRRSRWPAFTQRLDALAVETTEIDDMVRGASAVFERVQSATRQIGGI